VGAFGRAKVNLCLSFKDFVFSAAEPISHQKPVQRWVNFSRPKIDLNRAFAVGKYAIFFNQRVGI